MQIRVAILGRWHGYILAMIKALHRGFSDSPKYAG